MNVAINQHQEQVLAAAKQRQHQYTCLECSADVVLVAGEVNKPHFRHKSLLDCAYSREAGTANKMSDFHREIQQAFYAAGATLEVAYPNHRADVVHAGYVYEIQHSPISYDDVAKRNAVYNKVRWIVNAETLTLSFFDSLHHMVFMVNQTKHVVTACFGGFRHEYPFTSWAELVALVSDSTRLKADYTKYVQLKNDELEQIRLKRQEKYDEQIRHQQQKQHVIATYMLLQQETERKEKLIAQQNELNRKNGVNTAPIPVPMFGRGIPPTPQCDGACGCEAKLTAFRSATPEHLQLTSGYPNTFTIKSFWSDYCKFRLTHIALCNDDVDKNNIEALHHHSTTVYPIHQK